MKADSKLLLQQTTKKQLSQIINPLKYEVFV
jgi:hypothetical protein